MTEPRKRKYVIVRKGPEAPTHIPETIYLEPLCTADPWDGRRWSEEPFEGCGEPDCECASIRYALHSEPVTANGSQPDRVVDVLRDLEACERAIDRMGWDEIRAFMQEPGQSPHEDAGGFLLRKIKTLFGIKPDALETYQQAARRLVNEARLSTLDAKDQSND